jgi:DNA mismatch repair protein MutS
VSSNPEVVRRVRARLESESLTPMMRQYLTVKSQYPEAIVLFRMGDFFETFFEDAEDCAAVLDITLTARSKERDIPMAGVPYHAIDAYLARLIDSGRSVVFVDQVEDPKTAKGLVRREITRIVTPGTFLDTAASPRVAQYLAALVPGPAARRTAATAWGLAVLDLSTGEFRATTLHDDDAVADELDRLGVKEVLHPEAHLPPIDDVSLTARPFDEAARSALQVHFGPEEARALEAVLSRAALDAAGLVLEFVRSTQLLPEARDVHGHASLAHVTTLVPYEASAGLVLDARTREHLELFRARGAEGVPFLQCIDRAVTPPGGRMLARWVAAPLRDLAAIRARASAIEHLAGRTSLLDRVRGRLKPVGDTERLVGRVALGRATPRDLVALARALEVVPELFREIEASASRTDELNMGSHPDIGRLAELVRADPCAAVVTTIRSAFADDPPADPAQPGVFDESFDEELAELARLSRDGKALIAEIEAREKERTGIGSLKVRYNKVFGYFIEVTKANLHLVPEDYQRKQTMVNAERFFTPELKSLEEQVLTAEERRQERAVRLYGELLTSLGPSVPALHALAAALAEIDVLAGLADVALARGWARPVVDDGESLAIKEGRHPVLEMIESELGERFVPNDFEISPDERLVIITGPNMAGKSTIMRQVALTVLLAQMGSFVPAASAHIGRVDRIFTRVGAGDELSRGRSTFMVEMSETARILRAATPQSLVVLDEIGRGTSTYDGLSIAWSVAEYLHDRVGAKTLFATHYHELVELARTRPRVSNRHVAVKEVADGIVFLRKLLPGGANRSYGVQVARLAGLPRAVVERARQVLANLEADRSRLGSTDQLDLFVASAPPASRAAEDPLRERLAAIDVDDLTPRRALDVLAELQASLREDDDLQ